MLIIGNGGHAKVVRDVLAEQPISLGDDWSFIAVGNNSDRKKEALRNFPKRGFARLIHPSAVISPSTRIGPGTIVMAGCVIQADVEIGNHVIINTGATVDHDCRIGDFAHIAPGVHLCGAVEVGEGALVGVGACAVPHAVIASWSLVKAGTVAK